MLGQQCVGRWRESVHLVTLGRVEEEAGRGACWAGSTGAGGVVAQARACARRSQRGERLRLSSIQRKQGAALVFSFEAEEASGKNCSGRLGARRTQAEAAGLRRGQQGEDGGDRTRERAREAAGFGFGSRRLVVEQRTTMASGL